MTLTCNCSLREGRGWQIAAGSTWSTLWSSRPARGTEQDLLQTKPCIYTKYTCTCRYVYVCIHCYILYMCNSYTHANICMYLCIMYLRKEKRKCCQLSIQFIENTTSLMGSLHTSTNFLSMAQMWCHPQSDIANTYLILIFVYELGTQISIQ